jgi:hypothetical protein
MMDGALGDITGVAAPLCFLVPMTERPVAYNYEPPTGVPVRTGRQEFHRVMVRDGRPITRHLSLDREGFVLLRHPSRMTDFYDDDLVKSLYYPECERLIRETMGASRVVAFDHITRNPERAGKGSLVKPPAKRVHNDYTALSAPQRVRDLMGAEAEELLRHRYAIVNAWRAFKGPLLDSPLALCDAESLAPENLVPTDLKYPDRKGEIYSVTYNEGQRWYYFPKLEPDEVVLIRCFDSGREGAARFSAHGAFDDPTTPADAPPRESIEVRTLVFFAPDA